MTGGGFAVIAGGMTDSRSADFETILSRTASDVDSMLHVLLSDHPLPGEIARPHRLMEAIRHGVLAGGKRLRPFLVIETAAINRKNVV